MAHTLISSVLVLLSVLSQEIDYNGLYELFLFLKLLRSVRLEHQNPILRRKLSSRVSSSKSNIQKRLVSFMCHELNYRQEKPYRIQEEQVALLQSQALEK